MRQPANTATATATAAAAVKKEEEEEEHHPPAANGGVPLQQKQQQRRRRLDRFLAPEESLSLSDDAPGWGASDAAAAEEDGVVPDGPLCWKCQGSGTTVTKKKKKKKPRIQQKPALTLTTTASSFLAVSKQCSVCKNGSGRLPLSRERRNRGNQVGRITGRARRLVVSAASSSSSLCGGQPAALHDTHISNSSNRQQCWLELVQKADQGGEAVEVHLSFDTTTDTTTTPTTTNIPAWIPRSGEELCCLTGHWRILQKVDSHRWTTDDLVTAWVAQQQLLPLLQDHKNNNKIQYLDLGTGNASVLQMVVWAACSNSKTPLLHNRLEALGLEARLEAVRLARRSLSFNIGNNNNSDNNKYPRVQIQHADFRVWSAQQQQQPLSQRVFYDLITGTPPYFRVEFVVLEQHSTVAGSHPSDNLTTNTTTAANGVDSSSSSPSPPPTVTVQEARIRQGAMPTAKQSAPARCEFRGGIEAYCQTAAAVLKKPTGVFVVCENWQNHARVLQAAKDSQLIIQECWPVQGRPGKGNLFAVYVMRHATSSSSSSCPSTSSSTTAHSNECGMAATTPRESNVAPKAMTDGILQLRPTLTVRDEQGNWSREYQESVMLDMAIPGLTGTAQNH